MSTQNSSPVVVVDRRYKVEIPKEKVEQLVEDYARTFADVPCKLVRGSLYTYAGRWEFTFEEPPAPPEAPEVIDAEVVPESTGGVA